MSFTAVFIGGAFDMTKMKVRTEKIRVFFYEPISSGSLKAHNVCGSDAIACRKLTYVNTGKCRDGTLIYELEKA